MPRSRFVVEIVGGEQVGKAWDRFVEVHPRATIGHVSAWGRVIHDAYGHESIAFAAVEEGEVVGILPLVLVRSRLFGDRLVSMPFLDYGGILVDRACPRCALPRPSPVPPDRAGRARHRRPGDHAAAAVEG